MVENWARLSSVMEVRTFVGLASYRHHFVKNFASIATHLKNLYSLKTSDKKGGTV